jgi:hypothetical protein
MPLLLVETPPLPAPAAAAEPPAAAAAAASLCSFWSCALREVVKDSRHEMAAERTSAGRGCKHQL